jgi:tetratricopeptide (TPR) repeat protein
MLTDRYELPLSTSSDAARDAYLQGCHLALTLYPGAADAFDRAIAADPGFAMAHAGKAQVMMREGNVAAARAGLAEAKGLAGGVSAREAGHIGFFDLAFSGQTDAAITALQAHLGQWPREALMVAAAGNPNGLIGSSGRIGQKHQIAVMMDGLAPHYGDDWWFLAYHAMALSEDGQLAAARPKIERSVSLQPNNAHGAHGFAHVCYESGEAETARSYLSSWLATYPRDGFFHGHLSWHLSLCELQAGNWEAASHLYRDAMALEKHSGGGRNWLAGRAMKRRGRRCRNMPTMRCLGRAVGWLICTLCWRRPLPVRMELVQARSRIWRETGAIYPAHIYLRCREGLRHSNVEILWRRLPRWRR